MNSLQIIQPTSDYSISTPIFQGPLDLLLQLIERAELDITKLALAQVTDQYLDYLHNLSEDAANEFSAFLVVAAKLIQIKSEALLPRPPDREQGEEDLGDALARQLITYKHFKKITGYLIERENRNLRTYNRFAPVPKAETNINLEGFTINDLLEAAISAFSRIVPKPSLGEVVVPLKITIKEKIGLIFNYLRQNKDGTFRNLLSEKPLRLEIVITYLALLELVRRRIVFARQENLFGEIKIEPSETLDETITIESEFGE